MMIVIEIFLQISTALLCVAIASKFHTYLMKIIIVISNITALIFYVAIKCIFHISSLSKVLGVIIIASTNSMFNLLFKNILIGARSAPLCNVMYNNGATQ